MLYFLRFENLLNPISFPLFTWLNVKHWILFFQELVQPSFFLRSDLWIKNFNLLKVGNHCASFDHRSASLGSRYLYHISLSCLLFYSDSSPIYFDRHTIGILEGRMILQKTLSQDVKNWLLDFLEHLLVLPGTSTG